MFKWRKIANDEQFKTNNPRQCLIRQRNFTKRREEKGKQKAATKFNLLQLSSKIKKILVASLCHFSHTWTHLKKCIFFHFHLLFTSVFHAFDIVFQLYPGSWAQKNINFSSLSCLKFPFISHCLSFVCLLKSLENKCEEELLLTLNIFRNFFFSHFPALRMSAQYSWSVRLGTSKWLTDGLKLTAKY